MRNFLKYLLIPLVSHPLNRSNKVLALLRFVYWQLVLWFSYPKELVVSFVGKTKFSVVKGRTGLTGNLYCGLHEFYDMCFLLHFLRPTDTFFDIGANVGSYSILSAGHVGATTYSFEPVPSTFELLGSNRLLNPNQEKWHLKQMALGDNPSAVIFSTDRDTENAVVAEDYPGEKLSVEVDTLDAFCQSAYVVPAYLKIDAEGFDENVVLGGKQILADSNVIAISIESDSTVVNKVLLESGFHRYSYNPFKRTFSEGKSKGSNQLYIKDINYAISRVTTAVPIKVLGYSI
jgi:FkbM family methyltransferase